MAGMSSAALGPQISAAQAHVQQVTGATPAQTAANAPNLTSAHNAAATNFNTDAFIKALDLSYIEKASYAIGVSSTQDIIEDRTPEQFLDALKAGANDDATKKLVDVIRADPELAKAFHKAAWKDETVIPGIQNMAAANGTDGLGLDKVTKLLGADGMAGNIARKKATEALNKIADTELTFAHLETIANNANDMANFDFADFLDRMKNDPDGLIRDMFEGSGMENTPMGQMMAGFLKSFMPVMAAFIDPNGPIIGPYVKLGKYMGRAGIQSGRELLNDPDTIDSRTTVTNIGEENFKEEFADATKDIKNLDAKAALKALKTVDPRAEAEVKLALDEMEKDENFKGKMESIAAGGADSIQQLHGHMITGTSIKEAVNNVVDGVTVQTVNAAKEETLKPLNKASTVTKTDDTQFTKAITDNLKAGGDITVTKLFNAIRENAPADAQAEINALEAAADGNPTLTNVFAKMAQLSPEEVGKTANELYNKLEEGQTPALSASGLNLG